MKNREHINNHIMKNIFIIVLCLFVFCSCTKSIEYFDPENSIWATDDGFELKLKQYPDCNLRIDGKEIDGNYLICDGNIQLLLPDIFTGRMVWSGIINRDEIVVSATYYSERHRFKRIY